MTAFKEKLTLSLSVDEVAIRLFELPGFAWLGSHHDKISETNRFHIFAALPYKTLSIHQSRTEDPFCQLEEAMPMRAIVDEVLPFQGGAIGFISYDLGKTYLDIKAKNIPLNNLPLMHFNFYDFALVFDVTNQSYYLVSQNTERCTKDKISTFKAALEDKKERQDFKVSSSFTPLLSKDKYQQGFNKIKKALLNGDTYQVNYTHPFKALFEGDPLSAYLTLSRKNKCPFSAFLSVNDNQILSLSPERFFKLSRDRRIEVRPIKGTVARDNDRLFDTAKKDWLLQSLKNRYENTMIVDLMRNDLSRISKPFSLRVDAICGLLSLPAVHHLESVISSQLQDALKLSELFKALFPCGSITGAPKKSAMQFIAEVEPYERSVYCGAIGYMSTCGNMDFNVAIRTLVTEGQSLFAYAGGGIVMDSDEASEYQETLDKLSKILTAF